MKRHLRTRCPLIEGQWLQCPVFWRPCVQPRRKSLPRLGKKILTQSEVETLGTIDWNDENSRKWQNEENNVKKIAKRKTRISGWWINHAELNVAVFVKWLQMLVMITVYVVRINAQVREKQTRLGATGFHFNEIFLHSINIINGI